MTDHVEKGWPFDEALGLAEVFQRYVLLDPEVVELLRRGGTPDLFKDGQTSDAVIAYCWSLDASAEELARQIVGPSIWTAEDGRLAPPQQVRALASVLANRIERLRAKLSSADIETLGLSVRTGEYCSIHPRQWIRKGIAIDAASGDFCEWDGRSRFVPMWTGVEVRRRLDVIAQPVRSAFQEVIRKRSRGQKGAKVEELLRRLKLDAREQGAKYVATEVAKHLDKRPSNDVEWDSLEKLVLRISDDIYRGGRDI